MTKKTNPQGGLRVTVHCTSCCKCKVCIVYRGLSRLLNEFGEDKDKPFVAGVIATICGEYQAIWQQNAVDELEV